MTEADWLTCTDPAKMLHFLEGTIGKRKLRLFGAACCRRIWHLLPDERSQRAVEIGELLADGLVTEVEAEAAGYAAAEVSGDDIDAIPGEVAWRAARAADHLLPPSEDEWQLFLVWEYVAVAMEGEQLIKEGPPPAMLDAWSEQSVESGRIMGWTTIDPDAMMADILREIIGPIPFHAIILDPAWLTWNDGTIPKLAEAIYNERAFDRMPILADALEESGCENKDILDHCRQWGEHVRGCWVVDLVRSVD